MFGELLEKLTQIAEWLLQILIELKAIRKLLEEQNKFRAKKDKA